MSRKIVAVNAGPRKGWNTDTLITEASKGAESAGAFVERFDLFRSKSRHYQLIPTGTSEEELKLMIEQMKEDSILLWVRK